MNNDLISRSALKEAFEKTVCIEPMPYAFVKQIIDNAPTVTPEKALMSKLNNAPTVEPDCMDEDAKQASIPYSYQEPKDYIKNKLDYLHHDSITKSDVQL